MDADDRLRLDYEQTTQLYRTLVDVRFKLLAIVPTIAGVGVALLGRPRPAEELVAVGLLGLVATLGIFLYELRNSEVHDALLDRARDLEHRLSLPSTLGGDGPLGLFGEHQPLAVRLLGRVSALHYRALALVYAAALAGWSYLVLWGALGLLGVPGARSAGAVIGLAAGVLVVVEVERLRARSDRAGGAVSA